MQCNGASCFPYQCTTELLGRCKIVGHTCRLKDGRTPTACVHFTTCLQVKPICPPQRLCSRECVYTIAVVMQNCTEDERIRKTIAGLISSRPWRGKRVEGLKRRGIGGYAAQAGRREGLWRERLREADQRRVDMCCDIGHVRRVLCLCCSSLLGSAGVQATAIGQRFGLCSFTSL